MDEKFKLRIEYADVDSIKPYSKNARQHGEKDTDAIVESIREFGFKDPIGIGEDGTIIEGHGRLIAAKKLGMKTVPIIRLSDLTEEERKAYALAHNKTAELSGWDFDILETELKSISEIDMSKFGFDMEAIGEEEAEIREDDFVAKPEKNPTTKPGDVFRLGGALPNLRRFDKRRNGQNTFKRAAG